MRKAACTALAVGLSAAALPAVARAECPPRRGAHTLAKNRHALVVETRRRSDRYGDGGRRATVWGCLRHGRRWRRITATESGTFHVDAIRHVRLVGERLAYAWEHGDPRQDVAMGVRVYDLRARRFSTDVAAGFWPEVARVVLAPSGAVAFSLLEYDFEGEPPAPHRHRRIYVARGRQARVLDDGLEIRLNSLRLHDGWLTWRRGDAMRRERLR